MTDKPDHITIYGKCGEESIIPPRRIRDRRHTVPFMYLQGPYLEDLVPLDEIDEECGRRGGDDRRHRHSVDSDIPKVIEIFGANHD